MIRAILIAVILLILITAIAMIATPGRPRRADVGDRRLSNEATTSVVALGMLAVGFAVVLGFTAGDAWPLLPVAGWIGIYLGVRERARTRPRRKRIEALRGVGEFGADGVALMDRADAAIHRIMATEAAADGWLGELDFTADTEMIAGTLRRITALRGAAEELALLSEPTTEDEKTLRNAHRTIGELKTAVSERVHVLDDCADQAELVDKTLRRDDVRGRLDAMIDGAVSSPSPEASEAADMVQARVAAFLELKGIIDEQRRGTQQP